MRGEEKNQRCKIYSRDWESWFEVKKRRERVSSSDYIRFAFQSISPSVHFRRFLICRQNFLSKEKRGMMNNRCFRKQFYMMTSNCLFVLLHWYKVSLQVLIHNSTAVIMRYHSHFSMCDTQITMNGSLSYESHTRS